MSKRRSIRRTERRFLPAAELRVVDGAGGEPPRIEGYAAVFDSLSEDLGGYLEEIAPGAFAGCLDQDVRCLWNHNDDHVLGRIKSGTLTLREDERGLYYVATPPDTQWANDMLASLRRGDVDQSSFGFEVEEDVWSEGPNGQVIRRIIRVRSLYDVSPVTFPAYLQTSSEARTALALIRARKENRIRSKSNARAETGQGETHTGAQTRSRLERELDLKQKIISMESEA